MAYYALAWAACAATLIWAVFAARRNFVRGKGQRRSGEEIVFLPFDDSAAGWQQFPLDLARLGSSLEDESAHRRPAREPIEANPGRSES